MTKVQLKVCKFVHWLGVVTALGLAVAIFAAAALAALGLWNPRPFDPGPAPATRDTPASTPAGKMILYPPVTRHDLGKRVVPRARGTPNGARGT